MRTIEVVIEVEGCRVKLIEDSITDTQSLQCFLDLLEILIEELNKRQIIITDELEVRRP